MAWSIVIAGIDFHVRRRLAEFPNIIVEEVHAEPSEDEVRELTRIQPQTHGAKQRGDDLDLGVVVVQPYLGAWRQIGRDSLDERVAARAEQLPARVWTSVTEEVGGIDVDAHALVTRIVP